MQNNKIGSFVWGQNEKNKNKNKIRIYVTKSVSENGENGNRENPMRQTD